MAKTNANGTASAGTTAQILDADAGRISFFFKSKGDVFVLNFGASATASNVLQVNANESILLDRSSPYDITKSINVYCANSSAYQAQYEN